MISKKKSRICTTGHSTFDYYSQFNNELSFWKSIETRYNFVHFTRIYEFAVTVWTIFLVTIKNLVKMLRLQFIVQFVNINGRRCSLMFVCIYCFCRPLKFICTVVVINTFLYSVLVPLWISIKIQCLSGLWSRPCPFCGSLHKGHFLKELLGKTIWHQKFVQFCPTFSSC